MNLSKDEEDLLSLLRKIANQKVKLYKQFKEFTGIIGELATCQQLGFTWKPSIGYDAIDQNGNQIQIKTRRLQSSSNFRGGRLGRFGRKNRTDKNEQYDFKSGILVRLDEKCEIA